MANTTYKQIPCNVEQLSNEERQTLTSPAEPPGIDGISCDPGFPFTYRR